jgi:ABC-type hemin transport system ATPase subunit
MANSGIGIILVTHELPDVVPEIERVVLMSNGQIVADGRKEDVLQAEPLGQLFGLRVELGRRVALPSGEGPSQHSGCVGHHNFGDQCAAYAVATTVILIE